MNIEKIIIAGPVYQEMKNSIANSGVNKHFRFLSEKEVTWEDFNWADAYVGFRPTSNFHFGHLKWVHSIGAGVDGFLFNRKWDKDVLLTRTITSFGRRISEYCLSYILMDIQYHDTFKQQQSIKKWKTIEPKLVSEHKVVVFGTGEIGQELAKILSSLGVDVYGVSRSGTQKQYFHKVIKSEKADQLLSQCDWVINTLPLTVYTEKMFNEDLFNCLHNACFINVGRGASVDEKALIKALDNRNLRLAVLDVFKNEPLPQDSGLWERPGVIITPHIAALTTANEAVDCFLQTLEQIERGNVSVKNIVNIEQGY
jgi:D-2-hydroxyacid dehydrogenase (NADP+)